MEQGFDLGTTDILSQRILCCRFIFWAPGTVTGKKTWFAQGTDEQGPRLILLLLPWRLA